MAEAAAEAAEPFACGQEEGRSRQSSRSESEMHALFDIEPCLNQECPIPGSDTINEIVQSKQDDADKREPAAPRSTDAINDKEHEDAGSDDVDIHVEAILEDLLLQGVDQAETHNLTSRTDKELQALTRTFSQLSFDSDRARDETHERTWTGYESDQDSAAEYSWTEEEAKSDFDSVSESDDELCSSVALDMDKKDDAAHLPVAELPSRTNTDDDSDVELSATDVGEQAKISDNVDAHNPVDPEVSTSISPCQVPGTNETDSLTIEFIAPDSRNDFMGGFSNLNIFGHEPLDDISDDACSVDEISLTSDHSSVNDTADQEESNSSEQTVALQVEVSTSFCPETVESRCQEQMQKYHSNDNQDAHHDDCADWVDVSSQVKVSISGSISMAEEEEEPHPESPVTSPKFANSRSKPFVLPEKITHGLEDVQLFSGDMLSDRYYQPEEIFLFCQASHASGSSTLESCSGCQLHGPLGIQQLRDHLCETTKQILYLTTLLRVPLAPDKWKEHTNWGTNDDHWNLLLRLSSDTTAEVSDRYIANKRSQCDVCNVNMSDAFFRLMCEREVGINVGEDSSDGDDDEQLLRLSKENTELKKQIVDMQERERVMELENKDLMSTIESLKLQLTSIEQSRQSEKRLKDQEQSKPDIFNTLFLGHQNFEEDLDSKSTSEWMSAMLPDAESGSRHNEHPEVLQRQREWWISRQKLDTCDLTDIISHMPNFRNNERIGVEDGVDVIQSLPILNQNETIQWLNLENAHILVNHERCQERRRELVDTIKILRGYVDIYRSQRDDMKRQRDEAIVSAEKAWDQNAKLVSSTNPKQKIQYTMQMKNDNVLLHSRVRELQTQIASQVTSASVPTRILDSEHHHESGRKSTSRLCVSDLDDSEDPARLVLFRKMQAYMEEREAKILNLNKQRLALGCSQSETSPPSPSFTPAASARRRHASSLRVRS